MAEFGEFEEGEVGDLSDFEDSSQAGGRSQPLTPAGSEVEMNSGYRFDGRGDGESGLGEKGLGIYHSQAPARGRHNDDLSNTVECAKGRGQGRPGSLLNLLSDDEGPNVPKPLGVVRKKKRREWIRGTNRHATNRPERTRCRFFVEGRCNKGADCPFSHDAPVNAVEAAASGFPTDAGVSRQCLPHGEVAEPYGDVDYRGDNPSCLQVVRGGQLPMGFEPRPPRPDMDLDFDCRPYEYGPRAPSNYNTQRPRIFPPGPCRFPNGVGLQQEFQRARGPTLSPQMRFGFPPNYPYPRSRSPRPAPGRIIEPEKPPTTFPSLHPVAASSDENLSTVPQEGPQNDVAGSPMQPPPELTLSGDFVLSVSEQASDGGKTRQWHLLPLEIEEKSAYTALGLASANDPRLVSRVTLDPRLQTGRSKAAFSSAISTVPVVSKDSEGEGKSPQPQSSLSSVTPTENVDSQPKLGSKRRVKLQLNELANNFVAGASLAQVEPKESPTTAVTAGDRSYLLDPRLKRRRVVPVEQQQEHQPPRQYSTPQHTMKSPSDEVSGSAMQIAINGADSGQPA
ncbi:Zinc finger CCCH domain-containing protein 6 [Sparganum proliferum]